MPHSFVASLTIASRKKHHLVRVYFLILVLAMLRASSSLRRPLSAAARSMSLRASSNGPRIIYTETDEAPNLATYSFLPVVKKMVGMAKIDVEKSDISLSGRIISQFPEKLKPDQVIPDNLSLLGELAKKKEAVIVKLPNISASLPQLNECIAELRGQGYDVRFTTFYAIVCRLNTLMYA
jgi:hypothetical protein